MKIYSYDSCRYCKEPFTSKCNTSKYCGKPCRDKDRYRANKARIKNATGRKCRSCGDTIMNANYFYCSHCHYGISYMNGSIAEGNHV